MVSRAKSEQIHRLRRAIKHSWYPDKILKQKRLLSILEMEVILSQVPVHQTHVMNSVKKKRFCSICKCPGHNKRTCSSGNESISPIKAFTTESVENECKNEEKGRKNCENNWAELVVCLMILYPEIQTKEDVLQRIDDLILNPRFVISRTDSDCNIEKYVADIKLRTDIRIQGFISNFDKTIFQGDFIKIILSGKSFKEFPELVTLNTNPTTGQLYDKKQMKSDIYIVYSDSYIGISVKDSSIATLTNYSIEGMFHKLQIPNNLREKRINMLKEEFNEGYKYKKEQRKEANKLFYDKNNEYFKKIIEIIEDHNDIFTGHLVSCVFPKLNYDVYGYNGLVLKDLNSLSSKIHGKSQMIKRETKYETETAAKIWFSLYLDDIESWKFCIRGKNDIYKGSFQVLEFQKMH